ncbi:MAG: hypothetical protein J6Y25_04570 [Elusimicrobiaceae bacterium]|nr:hypothetical protein [Elusimicrobiaceae bacterium]
MSEERVGYCKKDDVKALFTGIDFDTDSGVGAWKIEDLIRLWTAYMDGVLRATYALPITDESDLQLLAMICARFVAGDIDEILNAQATDGTRKVRDLKSEAKTMLLSFRDRANTLASGPASRVSCICRDDIAEGPKEF